ncbi:hypothetical protein [Bradyrhizobium genosp. P]|uniref:hypothetical protein n=1 Tax=Bradyrhizobium genosp. P TaxID=83641 RepID=UPI003CF58A5E
MSGLVRRRYSPEIFLRRQLLIGVLNLYTRQNRVGPRPRSVPTESKLERKYDGSFSRIKIEERPSAARTG